MFFTRKRNFFIGAIMLAEAGCAQGVGSAKAAGAKLPAFNAPINQSSISGISSGAYMSVQFGVAWSSVIKGVGVVAGGPYYCAEASTSEGFITFGTGALLEAMGPCMSGPLDDIAPQIKEAQSNALIGAIDATSNIGRQKIYVFHGYNDNVVASSVTDATVKFYRHYLGARPTETFSTKRRLAPAILLSFSTSRRRASTPVRPIKPHISTSAAMIRPGSCFSIFMANCSRPPSARSPGSSKASINLAIPATTFPAR